MTDTVRPDTNGHGDPDDVARAWALAKTLQSGADELRERIERYEDVGGDYDATNDVINPVDLEALRAELAELDEDADLAVEAAIALQRDYPPPPEPPPADEATTAAFDELTAAETRAQAEVAAYERRIALAERGIVHLGDFLTQTEPEHSWLIPGLLEHGDRTILTGAEGRGKSTLLRQIAVQCSAGLNPFSLDPIEPLTVALFDLENSHRHVRRKLRPLALSAPELDQTRLWPIIWPAGIDLLEKTDRELFATILDAIEPDLVIIGPIYKLAGGDPTSEEVARRVAGFLDTLRAAHGFATILEAHQPYAAGGKTVRVERPYGASLWSRWPEFGLHLADNGALRHWRGDRDERDWPVMLERGGEWPWTAIDGAATLGRTERATGYANMLDAVNTLGPDASNRSIARELGIGESTVRRAIAANLGHWERHLDRLRKLRADPSLELAELGEPPDDEAGE